MSKTIEVSVFVKNATATLDGEVIATKPLNMTVEDFNKTLHERYPKHKVKVVTSVVEIEETPILNNEVVDKDTGEITKVGIRKRFNNVLDEHVSLVLRRGLKAEQYRKVRPYALASETVLVGAGIGMGLAFGKTALSVVSIGIGSYIVTELAMYQPRKIMYNKLSK